MRFVFIPQNDDQKSILQAGFLTSNCSGTLILPTGSGKSRLAWVAILHCLNQGRKAIYLAPTKAVLDEQYQAWKACIEQASAADRANQGTIQEMLSEAARLQLVQLDWFADDLQREGEAEEAANQGLSAVADEIAAVAAAGGHWTDLSGLGRVPTVGLFDGDHVGGVAEYRKADILLMTPERLDLALRHPGVWSRTAWVRSVGVCVIDEAQLLGEGHRGARLEGALIRLRLVNLDCRWIALSADLRPDDHALLNWIGEYVYHSAVRPVPQRWRLLTYGTGVERERLLVELLRESTYLSLVFVSSRRKTTQVGRLLARAGLRVSVHHAGRSTEQRQQAERQFKARELQVLIATSTLATGVNLPARQVVVYELYKYGGGEGQWVKLSAQELSQMAGRAGRPGFDVQGDVVILAHCRDKWVRRLMPQIDAQGYAVSAEKQTVRSAFCQSKAWLAEQMLLLVVGEYARSVEAAYAVVDQQSLAGRQNLTISLEQAERLCAALQQSGLIKPETEEGEESEESGKQAQILTATALGRVCSAQYVMPALAVRWAMTLEQVAEMGEVPNCYDWLALTCLNPDLRLLGRRLKMRRIGPVLSNWQRTGVAALRLHCGGEPLAEQQEPSYGRFYRHAAVLMRYTDSGGDLMQVVEWAAQAGESGLYIADLQEAIDQAVRLVGALVEVALALDHLVLNDAVGKLRVLAQRLKTGLSGQIVSLTLLEGIGAKRAVALSRTGIRSIADVAGAEVDQLTVVKGISPQKAAAIIQQARRLMQDIKLEWFEN